MVRCFILNEVVPKLKPNSILISFKANLLTWWHIEIRACYQCLNIQRWSEVCQVCSACVPNGPLITSLKTNVNSNHHIVLEEAIGRSQKNSKQYCIILIAIPFPATVVPPPNEPSFFFQKNWQNFLAHVCNASSPFTYYMHFWGYFFVYFS